MGRRKMVKTVDMTNSWGGHRSGAGRPKKEQKDVGVSVSVYLSQSDVEYLDKWGASRSLAVRALIERCQCFWPKGD